MNKKRRFCAAAAAAAAAAKLDFMPELALEADDRRNFELVWRESIECNRDFATSSAFYSVECERNLSGRHIVGYLRGMLSAVAALLLAIFGPPLVLFLRDVNTSKATDLAVFRVFSPLCGILAVVFFVLFFAASRLTSKSLRILLFWTPITVISTLGFGFLALFAYAWLHHPRG